MRCHGSRSFQSDWTDSLSDASYLGVVWACALVLWETVYRLSQMALHRTYGADLQSKDDGDEKRAERRTKLLNQGPSHCCSIVHSTLMASSGAALFRILQEAPPEDQYYRAPYTIHELNAAFLAFLVHDTAHILGQFPKLGGPDLLLHHAIFASCSIINGGYGIFPHTFCWLILGDTSTILLGLRWLCIHSERAQGPWFEGLQYAFAAVFFGTRVLLYNWGLHHLLVRHSDIVWNELPQRAPGVLVTSVVACLAAGGVLNGIWFYKIARLALAGARPPKPVPAKAD